MPDDDASTSLPAVDPRLDAVWRDDRRYLLGFATRMLGDRAAAEDVVQEAFGQLLSVPAGEVDDVRGWLTVVVRRLCLNRMRSAYARREAVMGASPPEPGRATGLDGGDGGPARGDPADRVTLDDQVRQALAVVLDRLSPAERTSFVLHDVFGFSFNAVAQIVGRTPAACRQLASRARRTVRSEPHLPTAPAAPALASIDADRAAAAAIAARDGLVAERFVAACAGGDIGALMALLDPDVVGDATLLGHGPIVHSEGAVEVATRLMGLFGPGSAADLTPFAVEDAAGALATAHGRVAAVIRLEATDDGVVHLIQAFIQPPAARPRPRS